MAQSSGNTVILIEPSQAIRTRLARLISSAEYSVRAFASARDYLAEPETDGLGCLLVEACMPDISGPEFQRTLTLWGRGRPVIFMSSTNKLAAAANAMRAGAVDFLAKPIDSSLLFAALANALSRDMENCARRGVQYTIQRRFDSLTPREREVMRQVVRGRKSMQIAMDIGTCEKTVKVHRERMMAKMGARSVAELVRLGDYVGVSMECSLRFQNATGEFVLHWR
jgi:two-component system, LuxR family, response regulator FixJ